MFECVKPYIIIIQKIIRFANDLIFLEKHMDNWKKEILEHNKKVALETTKNNEYILQVPQNLSDEEKLVYEEIVNDLKKNINFRLTHSDAELVWQYCQLKIMRDKAWREYNKNTDRYIRIVTGICSDGKTPKVMVKENEHYRTLIDCNKQLEKILKDLRLTPDARK